MMYRCKYCGRVFQEKCAHKCNTGFRKHNFEWQFTGITQEDYILLKGFKDILDNFVIPKFGKYKTLLQISKDLEPFSDYEIAKRIMEIEDEEK